MHDGLLCLASLTWHVLQDPSTLHFMFLWLNNIPPCGHAAFGLAAYQLVALWVDSGV